MAYTTDFRLHDRGSTRREGNRTTTPANSGGVSTSLLQGPGARGRVRVAHRLKGSVLFGRPVDRLSWGLNSKVLRQESILNPSSTIRFRKRSTEDSDQRRKGHPYVYGGVHLMWSDMGRPRHRRWTNWEGLGERGLQECPSKDLGRRGTRTLVDIDGD